MASTADDHRARTKRFAFAIINLIKLLPRNIATDAIARQLIRSGPGVSSNHRSACRARSRREFIAKLGVVLDEADESELWLEAHRMPVGAGLAARQAAPEGGRRLARYLFPVHPHDAWQQAEDKL